ncbi:MAG: hypothetical protein V4627_13630 [Pseudomonadota bacterium]
MDRRLGSTESIYYLLDTLYGLNFVVFAELDGVLDRADLDRALQAAQHEKPSLRTRIALVAGHPVFESVSMQQAPLTAQVAPLHNWRQQLAAQLDTPFTGAAPLARFFWFGGSSGRSVAAMVFHHAIADGKSGTHVLLDVLRRAGGSDLPMRLKPARASAQDLDPIQAKGVLASTAQKFGFWLGQSRAALKFARPLPGFDRQMRAQRCIKVIPYSLSKHKGLTLLKACRAQGTTVHGALGAAQVLAINGECGTPQDRHLALVSLADLRAVLHGALDADDLGLYITTLTTVHAVPASPDFWQLARDIKSQLSTQLHSGDANLIHSLYPQAPLLATMDQRARLVQAAAALAPPASVLTNIGSLPATTLRNGVHVRCVAFMVPPPPQHPICVTVAGYAGGLHLHLLYDQAKLDDARAQRMGDALMRSIEAAVDAFHSSSHKP